MPGFLHLPQLIEVMQMHVYRCSDFIHVDECVQNEKKQVGQVYKTRRSAQGVPKITDFSPSGNKWSG